MRGVNLQRNEEVIVVGRPGLATTWYKYLFTLGVYSIWHSRDISVLTDRRVLTGRGIISREEHSTPLSRVQQASYARRGLAGYCDIVATVGSIARRERLGPLPPRVARRFTRELDSRT